jgi:transposase
MDALIPSPHLIAFEKLTVSGLEMTIEAKTTRTVVHCPECQQPTQKVHSSYRRRPRDLPTAGLSVRLLLQTRKFFCENSDCSRAVFCERLPGCVEQYAHCTARLNQHLIWMGLALGGELGARLAGKLGYVVSSATLIQRVRNLASSTNNPASEIKVLGVDDFALRRGCEYGTLLVDLEKHQAIDLLQGREAAPLIEWLRQHPTVTTISRDRAPAYQEGATIGAPQAEQIADRWHVIKNLTSAFEEVLHRQASAIKTHWQTIYADELLPTAPAPAPEIERIVPPTPSEYVRSRADQCKRQQWHTTRKERYEKVQELKAEGLNIAQVARYLGVSYSGIRLLYEASEYPVIQRQAPGSGVEPYDAYLRERWAAGCHNAQQLHRELMAQGYTGSRVTVSRYVYPWRQTDGIIVNGAVISPSGLKPPKRKIPTARESVWILLKAESKLTQEERQSREQLLKIEPIKQGLELVEGFRQRLAAKKEGGLEEWIKLAEAAVGNPFKGFLNGIRRDYEAVQKAFTSTWSNGQTEGHVNRLKYIKRQMFGRAKFDLLKARVLNAI